MPNVNFYLNKPEQNGLALIYLQMKYGGQRFKYSFGQSINPANWDSKKQRVKSNKATTQDGQHSLNDLLDNLETLTLQTYRTNIAQGIPEKKILKAALDEFLKRNSGADHKPTFYNLLDRFITGEIKTKGKRKSNNTLKSYKTLKGHLLAFEKAAKYKVDYDTIDLNFLEKYTDFLRSSFSETDIKRFADEKIIATLRGLPLKQNSISKDVGLIKAVLKKAVSRREAATTWHEHEDFNAAEVDTDAVFLTDREIIKLYEYDLSKEKHLEAVRDLFVFGCYVGLRYSDFSTVRAENIIQLEDHDTQEKEYFLKMITQKTQEPVIIPLAPTVLTIFDKYQHSPNKLPKAISNQKFNVSIKEVCRRAGFTEKGRLINEPGFELWQCISSHTARRSFATNLYLQGFPVIDLMKITGHRTERAFLKYIRVSKLDAAKRLSVHIKKMWSEKLLRIA
jgi:integrase